MGTELDRVAGAQLDALQVPVPETVNCVSLRYQVAQKLHACTEVFDDGPENDRFRDVMDILLVEDLLRDVGLAHVRDACVDIFAVRDKHTWPPELTVYESWRAPFAQLARENGFTPKTSTRPSPSSGTSFATSTPRPTRVGLVEVLAAAVVVPGAA